MIYVFKLISGEEIIGAFESDDELSKNDVEYYNIATPMVIIDEYDEFGSATMKLRDAMLLSDEELMSLPSKTVMTYYPVSKIMADYYEKAVVFAKQYTKKKINRQIKDASDQLDEHMSEKSIEKVLRELRLRTANSGNGTVN
jgi:hypothetical protein